jgi:hypothetical protein
MLKGNRRNEMHFSNHQEPANLPPSYKVSTKEQNGSRMADQVERSDGGNRHLITQEQLRFRPWKMKHLSRSFSYEFRNADVHMSGPEIVATRLKRWVDRAHEWGKPKLDLHGR